MIPRPSLPLRPPVGRAGIRPIRCASARAILALILREMSTRFGRSPGGYIWAVVEPLGALIVMAFVFSMLLRSPSLGNSFLLFYATGYLPFLLYILTMQTVMHAVHFSRPLLMYPAVTWLDAILARFILNALTCVAVACIVLFAVLTFTDTSALLDVQYIVGSMALAAVVGLGHGTLNCALLGLFAVYEQIWAIAQRPLLIAAGVFFTYEDLSAPIQSILDWTPWIHITAIFRQGVYPSYAPDFTSVPLVLIWGMVPLALGLMLLRKHRHAIVMR